MGNFTSFADRVKILGIVAFLAIGVFCLYASWWRWRATIVFDVQAERTNGTVVDYEMGTRTGQAGPGRPGTGGNQNRTEKTRRLVIEFSPPGQAAVRFSSSVSVPDAQRTIGATVPVIYQRDDPAQAQIYSQANRIGVPVILLGLGVAAIAGALFAAFVL